MDRGVEPPGVLVQRGGLLPDAEDQHEGIKHGHRRHHVPDKHHDGVGRFLVLHLGALDDLGGDVVAHVEEQRGEAGEHGATPDEAADVLGVVHAGHVGARKSPLDVVVQTEQGGGVHDDQGGDVKEDQEGDVDLVVVLPHGPTRETGTQQLHRSHQVEHQASDGYVYKVDVGHGHGDLVGKVDHHQQGIVAKPHWKADDEVHQREDRQDESKVLAEPEVHAVVCLIVNHAAPHF